MATSHPPLIELKISVTLESCEALLRMLDRLSSQDQMPAARHVIDAIRSCVIGLAECLNGIREDSTLICLSETELEKRVTLRSQILPYLYRILGNIVQGDIGYIPAELTQTLRKQFHSLVPDSDVLIVSSFELNYEVIELVGKIEQILKCVSAPRPITLPKYIYRINLPTVEHDQALLHCIIAHEFGHPLSRNHNIKDKVLQHIYPDSEFLTEFAHRIASTPNVNAAEGTPSTQREFPFTEVEFRAKLTEALNRRLPNWIEELASDLYAFLLFGPAYLFSTIYFLSIASSIDSASETHPPPRYRFRNLFEFYKSTWEGLGCSFSGAVTEFLESWHQIASRRSSPRTDIDLYSYVTMTTLDNSQALSRIQDEVQASFPAERIFSNEKYGAVRNDLREYIGVNIPPLDVLTARTYAQTAYPTEMAALLNAAWEIRLEGFVEFGQQVAESRDLSPYELTEKLNRFLLKTLELHEVRSVWEKARNYVVVDRKNTPAS